MELMDTVLEQISGVEVYEGLKTIKERSVRRVLCDTQTLSDAGVAQLFIPQPRGEFRDQL